MEQKNKRLSQCFVLRHRRSVRRSLAWTLAVIAPVLLGLAPMFTRAALAQSSDIVIDVDSTVVLGCLDPFAFNITTDDLSSALIGGRSTGSAIALTTGRVSAALAGGGLAVDLPPIIAPLSGDLTSYDLQEVGCIIRASPSFGVVRVSMALTGNNVLTGPSGSRIRINSVRGRRYGSSGGFATSYNYSAIYHFFGDVYIEFRINVDLSAATAAGLHANAAGGTFTVEVTAP